MIRTIFWDVLEISAACTAVILLILLCSKRIGSVYGAKGRYLLWLVLMVRLAVPWNTGFSNAPVSVDRLVGTIGAAVKTAELRNENKLLDETNGGAINGLDSGAGNSRLNSPLNSRTKALAEAGMVIWRNQISGILAFFWVVGMVLFLTFHMAGYMLFRRKLRRWEKTVSDQEITVCYHKVCRELELKKTPVLKYASGLPAPLCIGVFHPAVYLSSLNMKEGDLYYIFKHELTHYKRHDIIYKFLLLAVRTIHFFNPFVHWMAVQAEKDMELSCDAAVVENCPASGRRDYSEAILRCISESRVPRTALSSHFTSDKKLLKRRFQNIMDEKEKRSGTIPAVLVLAAVLVFGSLVACGRENGSGKGGSSSESVSDELAAARADSLSNATLSDQTISSLWKWKTPYVGNNSAVGNMLVRISPYLDFRGFELSTSDEPYGVRINWEINDLDRYSDHGEINVKAFYKQAAILFSLIENAGYLEVSLSAGEGTSESVFYVFKISREGDMSQYVTEEELKQAGESLDSFKEFVNSLDGVFPDTFIRIGNEKEE